MLSQAIDVTDLPDDHLKMVIYGVNRCGKTTLACQFPKPLLLISFEPNKTGGAQSVKKLKGVTYLRITSTKQAMQLAEELKRDRTFKTHVLDTATSLQDIILRELLNLSTVPEQLDWGTVSQDVYRQRSEKTREALRPFLNLDANTVVCAKERDHNPPKDERNKITRGLQMESFLAADLGGATVGWLHDACDYIGRLYLDKETRTVTKKNKLTGKTTQEEVETGKVVRRLRSMLHANCAAGFRSCDPDKVPEWIGGTTPEEMYHNIMAVIKGE